MDYSARRLTHVAVWGLERQEHDDAATMSGTIKIQISAIDDTDHGPTATLDIAVPLSDDATIRDAERELLAGARAFLGHLSQMTDDQLLTCLHDCQPKQLLKKLG